MKSTPHYKTYANLSSLVTCGADDPKGEGRGGCAIYAGGTGTAVVRPLGGSMLGTNDRTLSLVAGMPPLEVEFSHIASGTATNVTVFWNR